MSYYRVKLGNSPIVHASPPALSGMLYCRAIRSEDGQAQPSPDIVTCPECRQILTEIWTGLLSQPETDLTDEYVLGKEDGCASRIRILARREVEGIPFIRFVRRWDKGQEQVCYYKQERLVNILIDGNAYVRQQQEGDKWQHQHESKSAL